MIKSINDIDPNGIICIRTNQEGNLCEGKVVISNYSKMNKDVIVYYHVTSAVEFITDEKVKYDHITRIIGIDKNSIVHPVKKYTRKPSKEKPTLTIENFTL